MLRFLWVALAALIAGCVPPVYEGTTYGIDDFVKDSCQISQGKSAILTLENQGECIGAEGFQECRDEVVGDDDVLAIALYYPKRPDRVEAIKTISAQIGFKVREGKIYLPHLSSIDVGGLTLNQVREKIQSAYQEELPESQVFVSFKIRQSHQVQIIGASQSMVPIDGRTRLSEVLAKAGIYPHANLFKSYVMRNDQQLPVDLYKLLHEGDETQNIVMCSGDKIFIARASDATVMVGGEVPHPMAIPIPYGFISLREALVIAGGIPFTGDKACIQVIRGNFIRPKVYQLAWRDITHLPNQSLLLMPGDFVYISEKPITQWNRFIEQLQPSITTIQVGNNNYLMMRE